MKKTVAKIEALKTGKYQSSSVQRFNLQSSWQENAKRERKLSPDRSVPIAWKKESDLNNHGNAVRIPSMLQNLLRNNGAYWTALRYLQLQLGFLQKSM